MRRAGPDWRAFERRIVEVPAYELRRTEHPDSAIRLLRSSAVKIALIVPGGVDRSGEVRVIPALLALIRRLAVTHELHVFATHQEPQAGLLVRSKARRSTTSGSRARHGGR